jgi:hypothetical protein
MRLGAYTARLRPDSQVAALVGTQAHPEFKSRPDRAHPLFSGLVGAARARARSREPRLLELDLDLDVVS